MRTAPILIFLACFATSVQAEDSPIKNTWLDSVIHSTSVSPEPWGEIKQVYNGTIGEHAFVLEEIALADLAAKLGTEVHHWEDGGNAVTWACLSRNAETLWLVSDSLLEEGLLTGAAIDLRDPAPASAGCGAWPADMKVDLGMMGLGLPADMIAANYLTGQPDAYGWFGSTNVTPSPLGIKFKTWQQLTFRANEDGTVNAVAVLQQTAD